MLNFVLSLEERAKSREVVLPEYGFLSGTLRYVTRFWNILRPQSHPEFPSRSAVDQLYGPISLPA